MDSPIRYRRARTLRHKPLTRLRARRALCFTACFLRSSPHGNSETLTAHSITPPTRPTSANPVSRTHAPPTTASLRRAIPGNIGETRSPSVAAALQYVWVNAPNCSRLSLDASEREYTGDPAGRHVVSYCRVCSAPYRNTARASQVTADFPYRSDNSHRSTTAGTRGHARARTRMAESIASAAPISTSVAPTSSRTADRRQRSASFTGTAGSNDRPTSGPAH